MAIAEIISSVLGTESFAEYEEQVYTQHQMAAEKEIIDHISQLLTAKPLVNLLKAWAAKMAMRFYGLRPIQIRLKSGRSWQVPSPVFIKAKPKQPKQRRGKPVKRHTNVLRHLGLEILGLHYKVSPALVKSCISLTALCPSFEVAAGALRTLGIEVNQHWLQNLTNRFAHLAIKHRSSAQVDESWQKPGLRILICVDGGRFRERKPKRGKRKQNQKRQGFNTDWVEPRLLTISQFDEKGHKIKTVSPIIDGSTGSLDDFFKLLKEYLCRLNLKEADEIVFCADGGNGLWPRIEQLKEDLNLHQAISILDYTHAKQNLKPIAELIAKGQDESEKQAAKTLQILKDLLWMGDIDTISFLIDDKLSDHPELRQAAQKKLKNYFGQQEMFRYEWFKLNGLPMGSGTVESAIRRVINLRIKGAGMFWKRENAENMIFLRCLVLTGKLGNACDKVLNIPQEEFYQNAMQPLSLAA